MIYVPNKLTREGFKTKKVVENLTKGENDRHAMKRILYDTGLQVVARWLLERLLRSSH